MKQVIAFSGGKDSTAMLLRMIELNEQIDDIFFADTGFEFPELYEYIQKIEDMIGRKITILTPEKDFRTFMLEKMRRGNNIGMTRGFPQAFFPCWWMREAKFNQIQKFTKGKISCVGIAADELKRVQKVENTRYPLIEWGWSEADCVNYLNNKKLLNPLYTNYNRIGCYHCPKQGEMSLYSTWKNNPELIEEFKKWNQLQREHKGEDILLPDGTLPMQLEKFENGYKPKKRPKYECFECKGVSKVFTDQCKLGDF